jgi:cell division protein FtsB
MESTFEKIHDIKLTLGQLIGWIISVATLLITLSFMTGNYLQRFETMSKDIEEGKVIGQKLNTSIENLTIEVKSLRQEMTYVNQRNRTTSTR